MSLSLHLQKGGERGEEGKRHTWRERGEEAREGKKGGDEDGVAFVLIYF